MKTFKMFLKESEENHVLSRGDDLEPHQKYDEHKTLLHAMSKHKIVYKDQI